MNEKTQELEKNNEMTIIACHPGKSAYVTKITSGLESMQRFVGGYIEAIYPFEDPVAIVCNEEGKVNGLELNRALHDEDGKILDIIAGDFFICGLGEEYFASIEGELQGKYLDMFKHPERFVKIENDILAIKVPEERQQETHSNKINSKK